MDSDKFDFSKTHFMRLKFKGIFDWGLLYRNMQKWFVSREFQFFEKLYKDKPPEIEVEWEANRKVTGYVRYFIQVKFHIWDLEEVEVVKEGVKKKMEKARVEIIFMGKVITNWQVKDEEQEGVFEENDNTKWWEKFFNKYVLDQDIDLKHLDYLYYMIYDLHKKTKEWLGMETRYSAY